MIDLGAAAHVFKANSEISTAHFTEDYAAPERRKGKASLKSDIFSLGMCLYKMMTDELLDLKDIIERKFKFKGDNS